MKILSIRPEPPGFGSTIARFDIALTDECRLYGLKLVEKPDGRRMTYGPQSGGLRVATFAPSLVEEISRAAGVALGGLNADDRNAA
ncbi:hypothetical protein [Mesorhizobium temperatum]|uniref:Uncharacterized protein n=1 Tax=Mesorhizobium temperatum TaxID=241416 RepID=A0A271LAU8_9HYPH|nr:hypothetical protein [Mesorhizobium temperatum]PAQ05224.1 hypothetical protein CIT26_30965 [Mesorhizobium temperatum]